VTAIAVLVALVLAAAIFAVAYVVAARKTAGPTRELAAAVRVLDQILAYDDSVASLSSSHRAKAEAIVRRYYETHIREIEA
jgi:hypothetical protein